MFCGCLYIKGVLKVLFGDMISTLDLFSQITKRAKPSEKGIHGRGKQNIRNKGQKEQVRLSA